MFAPDDSMHQSGNATKWLHIVYQNRYSNATLPVSALNIQYGGNPHPLPSTLGGNFPLPACGLRQLQDDGGYLNVQGRVSNPPLRPVPGANFRRKRKSPVNGAGMVDF